MPEPEGKCVHGCENNVLQRHILSQRRVKPRQPRKTQHVLRKTVVWERECCGVMSTLPFPPMPEKEMRLNQSPCHNVAPKMRPFDMAISKHFLWIMLLPGSSNSLQVKTIGGATALNSIMRRRTTFKTDCSCNVHAITTDAHPSGLVGHSIEDFFLFRPASPPPIPCSFSRYT